MNRVEDGGARSTPIEFPRTAGGKLCIEYVLIPGVNDRDEHARS